MRTITRIPHNRRRRGIGNVIASMVFIFLLIFMTGNLMVWSILKFSDYQNVVQEMNGFDVLRVNEKIEISSATIDSSNRLNVTVTNTGGVTTHVVSLWVINETRPSEHLHFAQNVFISRGASDSSIAASGEVDLDTTYTIRVATELGTIASFKLFRLADVNLRVSLFADPPTVIDEHDVTLSLFVFNNQTESGAVYGITPHEPDITIAGSGTAVKQSGPSPSSISTLASSGTAVFEWVYSIVGTAGTIFTFNTTYIPRLDNNATSLVEVVTGLGRTLNISSLQGSATFSPANFTLISHTPPILSYTAAGSDDDNVYFLNSTGGVIWQKDIGSDVNSVAMAAKSDASDFFIVAGNIKNDVYLWDKAGNEIWNYLGTGNNEISVAISANGTYVVVGSQDDKVYYFIGDGGSGVPLWTYDTGGSVQSVDLSEDGDKVVAGSANDNVYLWTGAASLSGLDPGTAWIKDVFSEVRAVDITKDGSYIVVGTKGTDLYYFDSSSSTPIWSVSEKEVQFDGVRISEDGDYVVAAMKGSLFLYSSTGPPEIWEYIGSGDVNSVSISSDGYYIVTGDSEQVRFFIRTSGIPIWSFKSAGGNEMWSVFVSDDGNTVVAGDKDEDVRVWKRAKELTGLASGANEGPAPTFTYSTGDEVHSVAFNSLVNPTVKLTNNNTVTGEDPLFVVLTAQSRLLFFNSTTEKLYTGALVQSIDEAGNIWQITITTDSGPVFPDQIIVLSFNIPADVKSEVPSGTYDAFVRLVGYDERGQTLTQTIYLGRLTF